MAPTQETRISTKKKVISFEKKRPACKTLSITFDMSGTIVWVARVFEGQKIISATTAKRFFVRQEDL